jgi:hypothetical protein
MAKRTRTPNKAAAKPTKKRVRRKKTKSSPLSPTAIKAIVAALITAGLFWLLMTHTEERYWREYYGAGQRAYARGNYTYSEKMYDQALREARRLAPKGGRVIETLDALADLYQAQGAKEEAENRRRQARALER